MNAFRIPRRAGWAVMALGLPLAISALAETSHPLPTPFPEARYQEMSARSPFTVASANVAPTAAPTPGYATQLYVACVVHMNGTDYVGIKSRDPDKSGQIFLEVGQATEDGIKVEKINWSDLEAKTTVDLSRNGEKATIAFDKGSLDHTSQPGGPVGGVPLPRLPRPVGFPQAPVPVGQPPAPGVPMPGQAGAQGTPGVNYGITHRRRGPVIPSGQ